jgi:hypothetical protein
VPDQGGPLLLPATAGGGPLEGDTVRFRLPGIAGGRRRSSHSVFEEWTMTRKSTSAPPSDVTYVGPTGASNTYYRHWSAAEQLPPISPKYVGAELWGHSFCQYGSIVGQESYHFVMPPSHSGKIVAYVSYASPGGHPFGPLDDGSNLPERAHFRNATYDASTRTFVGSLKWLDDRGVTLGQMKRWDIKLKFDTEFTCILSGLVKVFIPRAAPTGGSCDALARTNCSTTPPLTSAFASFWGSGRRRSVVLDRTTPWCCGPPGRSGSSCRVPSRRHRL